LILLGTHIWHWWVDADTKLTASQQQHISKHQSLGLGVSVFFCWEIAKLVENGKLSFTVTVNQWIASALTKTGIFLLDFTPEIAIESTQLPLPFHLDPADQIIVATARILNIPLLTADSKILNYPHVVTLT